MTLPRRRIVRPNSEPCPAARQRLLDRLAAEEASLGRWMARLRRAFRAVEKQQRRIARLKKSLKSLEDRS